MKTRLLVAVLSFALSIQIVFAKDLEHQFFIDVSGSMWSPQSAILSGGSVKKVDRRIYLSYGLMDGILKQWRPEKPISVYEWSADPKFLGDSLANLQLVFRERLHTLGQSGSDTFLSRGVGYGADICNHYIVVTDGSLTRTEREKAQNLFFNLSQHGYVTVMLVPSHEHRSAFQNFSSQNSPPHDIRYQVFSMTANTTINKSILIDRIESVEKDYDTCLAANT